MKESCCFSSDHHFNWILFKKCSKNSLWYYQNSIFERCRCEWVNKYYSCNFQSLIFNPTVKNWQADWWNCRILTHPCLKFPGMFCVHLYGIVLTRALLKKIFEEEMVIKTHPTSPLQICFECMLSSKVIIKVVLSPDDTCQGHSRNRKVDIKRTIIHARIWMLKSSKAVTDMRQLLWGIYIPASGPSKFLALCPATCHSILGNNDSHHHARPIIQDLSAISHHLCHQVHSGYPHRRVFTESMQILCERSFTMLDQ